MKTFTGYDTSGKTDKIYYKCIVRHKIIVCISV